MNELDLILDECVRRMAEGYSVEQCLGQYPEHGAELRPLLEAAQRLNGVKGLVPADAYKQLAKAKILAETHARRMPAPRRPAWQFAVAVTAFVVALLLSTTAFAQDALPGEPLYAWKLNSEVVWRAVSADPVGVDLTLVQRRATELTKVVSEPSRENRARDEFHEVLKRLEAEKDTQNGPKIEQALKAHQKKLSESGIRDEKLDDLVRGKKH